MPIIEADDSPPSRAQVFAQAVHDELRDPSVEGHFGRKYLAHNDQLRRVVWVPIGGAITPPKIASDRTVVAADMTRAPACAVCEEDVDVHIWAETFGLLEQLKDGLIAAANRQSFAPPPTVIPSSYGWAGQEAGEAGETNRSEKIVLRMTLRLPVPTKIVPLRRVTGFADDCGTIQTDGTITPQP